MGCHCLLQGVPEEDKKNGHEKILEEIIVEKFPKMGKEIITQVQETQRVPNRINSRQNNSRHILIKLTKIKDKEQILKAAREKQQITHKGIPIRITADLSIETLKTRREWQDILKVMKEKNLQPRRLYPARISFKYEVRCRIQDAWDWCTGMTQRDGMGKEVGAGFKMGNTCSC